jgi:hypothetical protein
MQHVVLAGDSILDNATYAGRGRDVLAKLERLLTAGDRATLLARDGAVIDGISKQLEHVPTDTTLLVISAGGNDALRSSHVLLEAADSVAESLTKILAVRDAFGSNYRIMLDIAERTGIPIAVCTIYDVLLPDPQQRRLANLALGVFNDVITREAVTRRLPIIDLRVMFTDERLFANAIEPSEAGSTIIAAAIQQVLAGQGNAASIYTGQ